MEENKDEIRQELSEEQVNTVLNVYDFLSFSKGYSSMVNPTAYAGALSPNMINANLQNKNMNPIAATYEEIEEMLKNPKSSEQILRSVSEYFEVSSMYYRRLIDFNATLPAFNLTFDTINMESMSEYNSQEFKDDLKVLDGFCNKFNFKEQFSKVIRQMLRQGAMAVVLRTESDKYSLQELPLDYTKITGSFPHGILYDFDFSWFYNRVGVDINMYPKIFKKMYVDIYEKMGNNYNPAKKTKYRNTTYNLWHQLSPEDGFWYFKLQPEITTLTPYYAPLFTNLSLQPTVRSLQKDKYFIEAAKLLVGIIGFNKDNKSGNGRNQLNMDATNLGKFMGTARHALIKQVGLTALPLESVQPVEFNVKERNMETENLSTIVSQSMASSESLVGTEKLNAHQSQLSAAIDSNIIKNMYLLFENFVDFYVNLQTKKYKFKVKFNDVNTPDDVKARNSALNDDLNRGVLDIQMMARARDLNPFEYERRLAYTQSIDLTKYITPIINVPKGEIDTIGNKRGRKVEEDSISDDTMRSKERLSNDLKEINS